MTDNLVYSIPCSLNYQTIHNTISERKIGLLEKRLNGPSKDGNTSINSQKKDLDLESIKIKLFQSDQQSITTKTSSKCSNTSFYVNSQTINALLSEQSKKSKEGNLYDFLLTKRNLEQPKNLPKNKTNKILKRKTKTKGIKSEKSQRKNKKLKDYYKISSAKKKKKTDKQEITNKAQDIKDIKNLKDILTNQEKLISQKDEEISKLNSIISELKKNFNAVTNYNKLLNDEMNNSKNEVIKFVKEIEDLHRKNLKKEINDKQYSIGKLVYQRLSNGQVLEYFEEGEEFKKINLKLTHINQQKGILLSLADKTDKKLFEFKINELEKEENELKCHKDILIKQKANLLYDINRLREESKCTYMNKWPLLGNRYQIISLLGKGGYSEVYKAYDLKAHIYVACKIHQLDINWNEQLKDNYIKHTIRENQILNTISHKNIVKHIDTIEINNNSFCTVLELCNGCDLWQYLKERKRISEDETKIIVKQILDALKYLCTLKNKIIHYDLKPQNIIFHNFEVKLTDFGLAKIIDENEDKIQLTSQGVGTYFYLPPECFDKSKSKFITNKVDIWSLGIVTYELLFGVKPFNGNYYQERVFNDQSFLNEPIKFDENIKISHACRYFILKCLEFDYKKRFSVFEALDSSFISK